MFSQQRDGRIVRQGNENKQVEILKYVTKNTFDAYSWALVEAKQKFIGQIFTSKTPVRSAEDIDESALSYAEVKALATGDPRIKQKMELDVQVAKLKSLRSSHSSEQYDMQEKQSKTIPLAIKTAETRISKLETDITTAKNNPVTSDNFKMVLNGVTHTERKTAGLALKELCSQVTKPRIPIEIGEYRGFPVDVTFVNSKFKIDLRGELNHSVMIDNDPVGNMKRIDNCVEGLAQEIKTQVSFLEQQKRELETIKKEVDKPFPRESEYQLKSKTLSQLNKDLETVMTAPREKRKKDVEKPSVLGQLKQIKQEGEQKKSSDPCISKSKREKSI